MLSFYYQPLGVGFVVACYPAIRTALLTDAREHCLKRQVENGTILETLTFMAAPITAVAVFS